MIPMIRRAQPLIMLVVLSIILVHSVCADRPLKMQTDKSYVKRNQARIQSVQKIKPDILFVGDSITEGWGIEGASVWRKIFEPLKSANYGCSGDRTQDLIWRLENAKWQGVNPRLIVSMIGVNDGDLGKELFNRQKKVIETINTLYPKSRIIFIPVLPVAFGSQPTRIYSCNSFAEKLGEIYGNVTILDMTKRFLNDDGSLNRSLYRDGIHLTAKGYEAWAEALGPVVKKIMAERNVSASTLPEDSVAYWKPYSPGRDTIVLYQFDGKTPLVDLAGKSGTLTPPDGVTVSEDGRFGKGLGFSAGHAPLKITLGENIFAGNQFLIDFWFKTDTLPAKGNKVYLLYKPHIPQKSNGFHLQLNDDGSLEWSHRTLDSSKRIHPEWVTRLKSEPGLIQSKKWHHLAIYPGSSGMSYIFGGGVGGMTGFIAVDGVIVDSKFCSWMYLNYSGQEKENTEIYLGSNPSGTEAFNGIMDQFRLLGTFRRFSPIPNESFVDPRNQRKLPSNPDSVAGEVDVLFKADFDDRVDANIAKGQTKAVRMLGTPSFKPGVKGQALCPVAEKGKWYPLCYAAKDNFNPGMGAMEMWFKPLGWQSCTTKLLYLFSVHKGGPYLLIPNDGNFVAISGGAESYEVPFEDNVWMHFVLVWAGRQVKLYVNGEKRLESMLRHPFDLQKKFEMISIPFHTEKKMLVDEFTIYRRPLSSDEVRNHYLRYFPGKSAKFIGPADLSYAFYRGVGKIIGTAYLRGNAKQIPTSVKVSAIQNGKILAEETVPYTVDTGGRFLLRELPVPMTGGKTEFKLEFLDAASQVILSAKRPLIFKRYPWLGNRIGITDKVLKPWVPITENNNSIDVVGRKYAIGPNGLFRQILDQKKEMLAKPMRLEAVANGFPLTINNDKMEIVERKATHVKWRSSDRIQTNNSNLSINTEGEMEYDGHTVFKFTLTPSSVSPFELDKLSLVVPLKKEIVKLYLSVFQTGFPTGKGVIPPYGALAEKDGLLFSSKRWYEYTDLKGLLYNSGVFDVQHAHTIATPQKVKLEARWKPTLGNFMPQLWVGNDEIGLSYMADSDAGWVPTDQSPAITLTHNGNTVEWCFNFISTPLMLKEPRTIVLSFQATPEKPQPPNWRKHFWRGDMYPMKPRFPAPDGSVTCQWTGKGMDEEGSFDGAPYAPERNKIAVKKTHEKGLKATTHLDTSWMSWGKKTAEEFCLEWDSGGIRFNQIFTTSKVDFFVWMMAQWKKEYNIDGVYFDTGTLWPNYNTVSGTAYILPDGRIQPGWTMFGQRECYKRCAHIFGDVGTKGFNWSCGYTGPQIAGWQWAAVPGGEYLIKYAAITYPGPFDLMRTLSNGGHFGTMMMWMGVSEYLKLDEAPENGKKFYRHMYAKMLPLDAKWTFGTSNYPVCFYQLCYSDPDVKFVGFWNNPYVSYLSEKEGIKTSLYLKPDGRSVIIVSNLSDQPNQLSLRLNAKKMGLNPLKAKILDGERFELMSKPNENKNEWKERINRGGVALMPNGDEKTRRIEVKLDGDFIVVNLLVPARDFRLLDVFTD